MTNVFHDLSAQVGLGFENAPGDDIALNLGEPDLHLIEPRGVGRRVVDMVAGTGRQPPLNPGMLMSGIIVYYQMNIESLRHVLLNMIEELQKLLMPVTSLAFGDHLT